MIQHKPLTLDEVIELMEDAGSRSRKLPMKTYMDRVVRLCQMWIERVEKQKDDYK